MNTSLPITSSFFWSSPVVFEEPASPESYATYQYYDNNKTGVQNRH